MAKYGWRGLGRKHPIARLKTEYERAKLPFPVLRQVRDLLKAVHDPASLSQHAADAEARRLQCHIELLRVRYEMSLITPTDKSYFNLSKAALLWLKSLDKLTAQRKLRSDRDKPRKRVPTAATSPTAEDDDEAAGAESDDAATA